MAGSGNQLDKSLYSNHTNDNAKFASKQKEAFEVQSLRSSESGSQLFDQNQSIYSRQSKNYNPFYHPPGQNTGMSGL